MQEQSNKVRSVLELRNITKEFPGVRALDGVNASFYAGKIHAVVGENGAGKSTLMNIIDGSYPPTSGKIILEGRETSIRDPLYAQECGIAMMHQEGTLLRHLTVMENIFISNAETGLCGLLKKKRMTDRTHALLERLQITGISPDTPVRELSIGERRLIEIAKVLAMNPKIMILDEPTASLTEKDTAVLIGILKQLRKEGMSILYISHRLEEIFELSDDIMVLRDGTHVGTFDTGTITVQDLIGHMVGRQLNEEMNQLKKSGEEDTGKGERPLLEVRQLSIHGTLEEIRFDLYPGEILGFAGLVGAGRTEVAEALMGYRKADSLEMRLDGKRIVNRTPAKAILNGMVMVPEDRRETGILAELSFMDNMNLTNLKHLRSGPLLNAGKQRAIAAAFQKKLNIKTSGLDKRIGDLSGGNQQKVVLARYLSMADRPKILILDEPTYGIDVGAKAEIYKIIYDLKHQGMSILLISSDMQELLLLSSRIVVLYEGRITGEISRGKDFDQKVILNYASGLR